MLKSVQDAVEFAKINGLREMLSGARFTKRTLASLAASIGESEEKTGDMIADAFPEAKRSTGIRTGKVYFQLA